MDERARIWAKRGRQKKTEKEWFKVFRSQLADMVLYLEDGQKGAFPRGYFRKQVIQLAAACEEALENSDAW